GLVSDLRYLPLTIPEQQVPNEIVRRLLGGPADWLKRAVVPLPAGIDLRGNVSQESRGLVIDFNSKAIGVKDRLLAQLRWTLLDAYQGPITLLIEGQEQASSKALDDALAANPAATLPEKEFFCIANEVVISSCTNPWAEADRSYPVLNGETAKD